jgi:rhodanese-related sulfurtransferase
MPSPTSISVDKLSRFIGLPKSPQLFDVRTDDDFAANPKIIPGSKRRDWRTVGEWACSVTGDTIVYCQQGLKLSEGVAAWLRHCGVAASTLEGGFEAWVKGGWPVVATAKIPAADAQGRTIWVTRSRPKIDRIACPWLIRRFIDPSAVFLFVAPSEVKMVAERFSAAAFDVEGTFWSHRGQKCTFDTMIEEFELVSEPMTRLASIVRAADTAALNDVAEASGLLAVSLGLSRLFSDDLQQLEAGMLVYDALYRWCRDATEETHNWPTNKARPR